MYKLKSAAPILLASLLFTSYAMADITVPMKMAGPTGPGKAIGNVTITETQYGLVFTPDLTGLPPGEHGFHVHTSPSCAPMKKDGKIVPALAAGGHFDPDDSKKHGAPWGTGHLGDLPSLIVDADGRATEPVLAPRLHDLNQLKGHSLMIHAGGDNFSDSPKPLGGGGARIACGVIQ
ncbi:MAG: superoxide dismutase [Cu-Zn] SodC [Sulfuriferula sp.]